MADIKDSYDAQAENYDDFIRKLVPGYDFFLSIAPVLVGTPKSVLDIGCGTGSIAASIRKLYPETQFTCVDPSDAMLKKAAEKINAEFVQSFVEDYTPEKKYDAVTSVMVMHNVQTIEQRKEIYKKIYDSLNSPGVYVTADIIQGETEITHKLYLTMWRNYMLNGIPQQDVDNIWLPNHMEKDKPVKLSEQMVMLYDAGFRSIDIVNKNINFAMLVAYK